jgi:hypothetical protein
VFKAVNALNNLLGALVSLVILALIGVGGWLGFKTYFGGQERDALAGKVAEQKLQIERLESDLELTQQRLERAQTALRLLKVDHRVAQLDVVKQQGSAKTGDLTTTFNFAEVDDQGKEVGQSRMFTVKGDMVYVETLVVKFTDEAVESADPFRSTSICLFRRVFGENQNPKDGFVLDAPGDQPIVYRTGGPPSDFEKEIWSRFWDYSNNPDEAAKKGIRAAHGEAPSQKLLPGMRYKLNLRASGGLSIQPEKLPGKGGDIR